MEKPRRTGETKRNRNVSSCSDKMLNIFVSFLFDDQLALIFAALFFFFWVFVAPSLEDREMLAVDF